ncbi:MAG: hypothetical protein GWN31_03965 [Candidatus Thorarchaeota archaeon]|nr:hypothetical protein [Candidatus Thorarchaeota archaeon]NIW13089.1 hypothetical protein [Candidatus Thorarchaeota archaeon]
MPVFEIRERENWTAIIREIYHAYSEVTVENIYQVEAETEDEAVETYRRRGIHIDREERDYYDTYDSEWVDTEGEVDRELDSYDILEITNLSEEDREEESHLPETKTPDHVWEV